MLPEPSSSSSSSPSSRFLSEPEGAATSHPPFPSGSTVNFYSQERKKNTAVVEKENIKVSFIDECLASASPQRSVSCEPLSAPSARSVWLLFGSLEQRVALRSFVASCLLLALAPTAVDFQLAH